MKTKNPESILKISNYAEYYAALKYLDLSGANIVLNIILNKESFNIADEIKVYGFVLENKTDKQITLEEITECMVEEKHFEGLSQVKDFLANISK